MSLAGSFKGWLRKNAEKVARRFYEGPAAPERLLDEVEIFEKLHPEATPEQWRTFVTGALRNAYQDGYMRGYEHRERLAPSDPQALLLGPKEEAERHDWRPWQGQPTSGELRRLFEEQLTDPLAHLPPEARAAAFAELGQFAGTFRVVWGDDPAPWRKSADPEA